MQTSRPCKPRRHTDEMYAFASKLACTSNYPQVIRSQFRNPIMSWMDNGRTTDGRTENPKTLCFPTGPKHNNLRCSIPPPGQLGAWTQLSSLYTRAQPVFSLRMCTRSRGVVFRFGMLNGVMSGRGVRLPHRKFLSFFRLKMVVFWCILCIMHPTAGVKPQTEPIWFALYFSPPLHPFWYMPYSSYGSRCGMCNTGGHQLPASNSGTWRRPGCSTESCLYAQ